ncbi:MAG: ABC transporter permease subunit [Verrucomicrobiota bacterium]
MDTSLPAESTFPKAEDIAQPLPSRRIAPPLSWTKLLTLPAAAGIALCNHLLISQAESPVETQTYTYLLSGLLAITILFAGVQKVWSGLRAWMDSTAPLFAAAFFFLIVWEVATTGIRLLPLPYFPSPAKVLQSLIDDRVLIWDSTWHSLLLLVSGYLLGITAGLISGVCIGWFGFARYWGMPILKVVGPIPATAWIPLVLIVSPDAFISASSLIALAVWFPVTMLTASGISNTRASYLDVARTLGAKPSFLIFRVAIPAAMPNIFIGLFMGLGAAFLTLVVAENVGVKSGLGWYLSWSKEWAEYGKVYAVLAIMSLFFSSLMTLLFKVRDRILVWQKGTIKW